MHFRLPLLAAASLAVSLAGASLDASSHHHVPAAHKRLVARVVSQDQGAAAVPDLAKREPAPAPAPAPAPEPAPAPAAGTDKPKCERRDSQSKKKSKSKSKSKSKGKSKKKGKSKSKSSKSGYATDGLGKIGVAWPMGESENINVFRQGKNNQVGWYYTWSAWRVRKASKKMAFFPMFWGASKVGDFKSQVYNPIMRGHFHPKAILGFNEPNQHDQSAMSPAQAAQLWKQYMAPLKRKLPNVNLITPACTSAPTAIPWLKKFFAHCPHDVCHTGDIAIHWYGNSAKQFISFMNHLHKTFPKKRIWVTEYACQNFAGGPQCSKHYIDNVFFPTTTKFMLSRDWIAGYAAFGAMHNMNNVNPDNRLIAGNGRLNRLGWNYVSPDY